MKKKYAAPEVKLLVFRTEAIASFVDGSLGTGENPFPEEEE